MAISYTHTQATPSTVWGILHNLGYHPAVSVFTTDSPAVQLIPTIEYTSEERLNLIFDRSVSGVAYLS